MQAGAWAGCCASRKPYHFGSVLGRRPKAKPSLRAFGSCASLAVLNHARRRHARQSRLAAIAASIAAWPHERMDQMKITWGAAFAFAACSLNATASAETWSCDLKHVDSKGEAKTHTVRYTVSNDRMTSSSISNGQVTSARTLLKVTLNDDRFLVAFAKLEKEEPNPLLLIIIEKKNGSLLSFDNVLMTVSGKTDSDLGPNMDDTGHCTLSGR
jgi:hypothetical protein